MGTKTRNKYLFVENKRNLLSDGEQEYAGWLVDRQGMRYYIFRVKDEILGTESFVLDLPCMGGTPLHADTLDNLILDVQFYYWDYVEIEFE